MEQFEQVFKRYQQFRVLICKRCRHAVQPKQVKRHLDTSHRELTPNVRSWLAMIALGLTDIAQDDQELIYPNPSSRPIPELKLFDDGFQCTMKVGTGVECGQIYRRQVQNIQRHCRETHQWENPNANGRRPTAAIRAQQPWIEGVHCQQFSSTGSGPWRRLFQVQQGRKVERPDRATASIVQAGQQEFDTVWKEAKEAMNHAVIDSTTSRYNTAKWLSRTGWLHHLRGFPTRGLLQFTDAPTDQEGALRRCCRAIDRMIFQAQRSSQSHIVGWNALNYIERREFGSDSNVRPFYSGQLRSTMEKYIKVWRGIFCYIWRTEGLPVMEGPESHGDGRLHHPTDDADRQPLKRPRYRFTTIQVQCLRRIQAIVGVDDDTNRVPRAVDDRGSFGGRSRVSDADETEDENEEVAQELDRRMLSFWISLLDHHTHDNEYRSALVSGLAILGIQPSGEWKSPLDYTPVLSAVVTVAKMLVLHQARLQRREEIQALVTGRQMPPDDAEVQAVSHYDRVKDMADRFLQLMDTEGFPTPMDWMLRLRWFGSAVGRSMMEEGAIDWMDDQVIYGPIRFTMSQLRSTIHGLVHIAKDELIREVLLLDGDPSGPVDSHPGLPEIPWITISDHGAETRFGWNFLQDERTAWPVDGRRWLFDRVLHETELRHRFIQDGTRKPIQWQLPRLHRYRQTLDRFREHLAVLVHLTGGQPARGPELLSIQHRNGAHGSARGVFIDHGSVVLVTGYHKGFNRTARPKVIHRYLPQEVGELVIWYLWLVEPFWRTIDMLHGGEKNLQWFWMWAPKETEIGIDRNAISPHRKKRKRRSTPIERAHPSININRRSPSVSSTSEPVKPLFPRDQWETERVRTALQRVTEDGFGQRVNIRSWRHICIAIFRKFCDPKTAEGVRKADDEDEDDEDEAYDLQAGHSTKTAHIVYGRGIDLAHFEMAHRKGRFYRVSVQWHRFLQFESALQGRDVFDVREVQRAHDDGADERYRRWQLLRLVNIQEELERLLEPSARCRGIQEPALTAIMRGKSPIIAIMGTGGGKSILFQLPASCSTGVTVVVVPLVSLRDDLKRRCQQAGIDCMEWDSRKPREWAQIVLVTPESVDTVTFHHWVNRLLTTGRLDRFVIDECHVVLDSIQGWRPRMLQLRELVRKGVQMVYLTATLPPRDEVEFMQLMGLPTDAARWNRYTAGTAATQAATNPRGGWIFRSPTSRANVRYRVEFTPAHRQVEAVVRMVDQARRTFPTPGQIIVYCDRVHTAIQFAAVLRCACFHRTVGSRGQKEELVRRLTDGTEPVWTATNALGLGIDAPTIRMVIHVGTIRTIRDYAQESGRAGRDGQASEAIIIQTSGGGAPPTDMDEGMKELIFSQRCVREVLDEQMDGNQERRGCRADEEPCFRCQQRIPSSAGMKAAVMAEGEDGSRCRVDMGTTDGGEFQEPMNQREEFQEQMDQREELAQEETARRQDGYRRERRLRQLLETWKRGCPYCRAGRRMHDAETHPLEACQADGVEEAVRDMERLREQIRWQAYSGCTRKAVGQRHSNCHVPQALCQAWRNKDDGGFGFQASGLDCQYAGVLMATLAMLFQGRPKETEGYILRRFGVNDEREVSSERLLSWLGRKVRIGEMEASEACNVIIECG